MRRESTPGCSTPSPVAPRRSARTPRRSTTRRGAGHGVGASQAAYPAQRFIPWGWRVGAGMASQLLSCRLVAQMAVTVATVAMELAFLGGGGLELIERQLAVAVGVHRLEP